VGCHNGIGLGGQVLRRFPLVYHTVWSLLKPKEVQALQKKYNRVLKSLKRKNLQDIQIRLQYLNLQLDTKEIQLLEKGFFDHIEQDKLSSTITTTACQTCHQKDTYEISDKRLKTIAFPFQNIGGFLGKNSNRYFRVPLLRNIVQTKPYFHNGEVKKLEEAIKIMGIHQSRTELSDTQISKIVAFLKAVDGELIEYSK